MRGRYRAVFFLFMLLAGIIVFPWEVGVASVSQPAGGPPEDLQPGDTVTDHGITVVVPAPGRGVFAEGILEDGTVQALQVETRGNGDVVVSEWGDESSEDTEPGTAAPAACSDPAFVYGDEKWDTTMKWWFRSESTPANLNVDRTLEALRDATRNITQENNNCGYDDSISATAEYQGSTGRGVQINTEGSCFNYSDRDGYSVAAFGPLTGWLGFACRWWSESGAWDTIKESDVRLSNSKPWSNGTGDACSADWVVEAVMTHERGHSYGMKHVSEAEHGNLTMSTAINGTCQKAEATLGLGDMLGLEQIY